jgi:hypothetical protein
MQFRSKKDKKILENANLGQLIDMTFAKKKEVEFKD